MFREICSLIDADSLVIGPSSVAVQSVVTRWLRASGRTAARRPNVLTLGQWLTGLFQSYDDGDLLLTENQAALVWEQAAANALSDSGVLNPGLAGRLARRAWALAREHDLERALGEGPTAESAWLHALARGVEARLGQEGWVDPALLVLRLADRSPSAPAGWFGFDHFSPALRRLVGSPRAIGDELDGRRPQPRKYRAADPRRELHAAFAWAASHAVAESRCARAIVIPDLAGRWNEVERIGARYGELAAEIRAQRPLWVDEPLQVARALIEVATGERRLAPLLKVLQSPFCLGGESSWEARTELERQLRARSVDRLPPTEWPSEVPPALSALRRLALEAKPGRQTPVDWAARFREILVAAEWPGQRRGDRSTAAVSAMASALDDLSGAALVLGPISAQAALSRLQSSLRRRRSGGTGARLQLAAGYNELAPGLSGIWVTGANAGVFPPRPRPVALLPMRLQREYGLPIGAAVDGRRLLHKLSHYADDVVLSWVQRRHDAPMAPSPLLDELTERRPQRAPSSQLRPPVAPLDRILEGIPPLTASPRSRSARLLTLQAKCPARAFFEGRLGLRPVERLSRGVSAKERGILVHRVLEDVYRAFQEGNRSLPIAPAEAEPIVASSLAKRWPPLPPTPRGAALVIEKRILAERVRALLVAEALRPQFRLRQTEAKLDFRVGDLGLRLRLDRVDEHQDGSVSVIDYKTGNVHRNEFLAEPIVELQLPLYALGLCATGEKLGGALLLQLAEEGARYEGAWETDLFPNRSYGDLQVLLQQWASAATALADEFVAGTGWLRPGFPALAGGDWAPLIRPGAG